MSEPLMTCRNVWDDVETRPVALARDKPKGNLLTAWVASGMKVGSA